MGHGHVIPNLDGSTARCGGPALCDECAREQATMNLVRSISGASSKEIEWSELHEKIANVINDVVELRLKRRDPEIGKFLSPLILALTRERLGVKQ